MKKFISLCLTTILVLSLFAGCKDSKEKPANAPAAKDQITESAGETETKGKYEDAEVYENKEGTPAAKTEDGDEVELTGENLASLYAEYEKVRGTGSEKEKELLDKIQVILDVTNNK